MNLLTSTAIIGGGIATGAWLWHRGGATANVVDTAIIDAGPATVFQAIVDEHDGTTGWWPPHQEMALIEGDTYADPGALVATTVRVHRAIPIHFTTRTVDAVADECIRVDYVSGAFRGKVEWLFEPADGRTRLSMYWRVRPVGILRLLAPLLPITRSHSDTTRIGFEKLDHYLAGARVAEPT